VPRSRAERAAALLAAAYFALVALDVVLAGDGLWTPHELAASPSRLGGGDLPRLLSSALVVEGAWPLAQVAAAALAAVAVVRRHGAWAWWGTALSAQVGSALVVYAAVALAAAGVDRDLDYGVSVVLTGSLGALFAGALLGGERGLAALCALALAAFVPFSLSWYGLEHPLGFGFGAAFLLAWEEGGRRRCRARRR
jgi:hypothetical protein